MGNCICKEEVKSSTPGTNPQSGLTCSNEQGDGSAAPNVPKELNNSGTVPAAQSRFTVTPTEITLSSSKSSAMPGENQPTRSSSSQTSSSSEARLSR